MPTYILGLSAFFHDSAAALLRDGEIVAAAQEERFTRKKGDARFPKNAIDFCLKEVGISASELDFVAYYEKPLNRFDRLLETYLTFAPKGFRSFKAAAGQWTGNKLHLEKEIQAGLGGEFQGRLCFMDHHESHAASAFFPSPFEEAAILTLDAVGEWSTSSIGVGKGHSINLSHEMRFPHSLGMLYSAFTYYTGFKVNSGEYKLMGLAPYGVPKYADLILNKMAILNDDGSLWLDMDYFSYCHGLTMTSEKFHRLFGQEPRKTESEITQQHMDLAASIQVVCEEVVLRAARFAHQQTSMTNLVMAGGVALNCVSNGRLLREGPFQNIWVQPAAGDAGGSLGAAFMVWHHLLGNTRKPNPQDHQQGSFLGPSFCNEDIKVYLEAVGAQSKFYENEDDLLDTISTLISQEKVIGWFHGRMEFGPRALGSRSIIGDPRSTQLQQDMNLKIKFRESFRPFAPCVLKEYANQIFDVQPGEDSPYMLFVTKILDKWKVPLNEEDIKKMQDPDLRIRVSVPRSTFPAITHVDYSARIQTIDPERHGRFYRLMRKFHQLTGCPAIINTSFNIRGEPIVHTFEDAYRCFMATGMDALVLENFILLKDDQPPSFYQDIDTYKSQYALD